MAGLTKAFLGVGDNQKELSFSDHTHNLTDLGGILGIDKGGTGVSSLAALKSLLGVSSSHCYIAAVDDNGKATLPNLDWVLFIGAGRNRVTVGYRTGWSEENYHWYQVDFSGTGSNVSRFYESGTYSYYRSEISVGTEGQVEYIAVFYK